MSRSLSHNSPKMDDNFRLSLHGYVWCPSKFLLLSSISRTPERLFRFSFFLSIIITLRFAADTFQLFLYGRSRLSRLRPFHSFTIIALLLLCLFSFLGYLSHIHSYMMLFFQILLSMFAWPFDQPFVVLLLVAVVGG